MIKPSETISKIARNGHLTIPAAIRQTLHLRDGDFVRLEVSDNHLIITPASIIDKKQTYFYTKDWQEDETKANEDIKAGKVTKTKNLKELFKKLDT